MERSWLYFSPPNQNDSIPTDHLLDIPKINSPHPTILSNTPTNVYTPPMNKKYLYALIACFISLHAQATTPPQNPYFELDSKTQVGTKNSYESVQKAVFQARFADHPFITGSCSATYISNEGHFITALHCIRHCIEKHEASPYILADIRTPSGKLIDALVPVLPDRLMNKTCTMRFGETEEREAEVIAFGPGFTFDTSGPVQWLVPMLRDSTKTENIQKALFSVSSGIVGNLDFAILKFKDSPKTECLPFSQKKEEDLANLSVWSMAYPAKTNWTDENLADGKTRLVARGKILPSYLNSTPVREYAEKLKESKRLGETQVDGKLDVIFNLYGTKIATIPADQGSSGASVLDESDASIVGVMSYVMTAESESHERATFIMLGQTIKSYVEEYFPEQQPDKIFKCNGL
jgi:V8-like Glu-specific endopeptidase